MVCRDRGSREGSLSPPPPSLFVADEIAYFQVRRSLTVRFTKSCKATKTAAKKPRIKNSLLMAHAFGALTMPILPL